MNIVSRKNPTPLFMNIIDAIQNTKRQAMTTTANGCLSNSHTQDALLELFSKVGAARDMVASDLVTLFAEAAEQDLVKALKILFYARDTRGGQGERETFRRILAYLGDTLPVNQLKVIIPLVPEFGRWDDLFSLRGTKGQELAYDFMRTQLSLDMVSLRGGGSTVSLLAKWLKSENTSSSESVEIAREFRKFCGLSSKNYRKILSALRNHLNVVETKMCSDKWNTINFSQVPSRAHANYGSAFARHDTRRYTNYLANVKKGAEKINSSVLFPYDLVHKVLSGNYSDTVEAQWNALPNYIGEGNQQGIVVCDVSGSMAGRPLEVAISLALYISERTKGLFHNKFLTFSSSPELVTVRGNLLLGKVHNIKDANWGQTTNLVKLFELVLNSGVKNNVPQEEMPSTLYIVSDMEFDVACADNSMRTLDVVKAKYAEAGYTMPKLVFWNVNAHSNTPITKDDKGTCIVSGCSPTILTSLLGNINTSPIEVMENTINTERYNIIDILLTPTL